NMLAEREGMGPKVASRHMACGVVVDPHVRETHAERRFQPLTQWTGKWPAADLEVPERRHPNRQAAAVPLTLHMRCLARIAIALRFAAACARPLQHTRRLRAFWRSGCDGSELAHAFLRRSTEKTPTGRSACSAIGRCVGAVSIRPGIVACIDASIFIVPNRSAMPAAIVPGSDVAAPPCGLD